MQSAGSLSYHPASNTGQGLFGNIQQTHDIVNQIVCMQVQAHSKSAHTLGASASRQVDPHCVTTQSMKK